MSNREPPLVLFPGALGDLVCFVPALRAIGARAGARPHLLCRDPLVPLVRATALADAASIDGREVSWLFRRDPPAEAAAFYGAFSAVDSFTGAASEEARTNLARWTAGRARLHAFRPPPGVHAARHFARAVTGSDEISPPRLALEAGAGAAARAALAARLGEMPDVVLHPGSGGTAKRWSRRGFAEVGRALRGRGLAVVVLLGPAEGDDEAAYWRREDLAVASRLDLVEAAALLAAAPLYLGNDSGASHLAAALGASGLALFGPTDPAEWAPVSTRLLARRLEPWSGVDADPPAGLAEELASVLAGARGMVS